MHLPTIDKQCTLCLEVFCLFWQCFQILTFLHILVTLWKLQYFAYSGSALKDSIFCIFWQYLKVSIFFIFWQCFESFNNLSAKESVCGTRPLPLRDQFSYSGCCSSPLLVFDSTKVYPALFLWSPFFSILILSMFYLVLFQRFAFCAISSRLLEVKKLVW